ncbi:MAG: DUF2339 domain-containing protein, partial [Paludibacter sp.]
MNTTLAQLDILQQKLEALRLRQNECVQDINSLEREIAYLKSDILDAEEMQPDVVEIANLYAPEVVSELVEIKVVETKQTSSQENTFSKQTKRTIEKTDIEKFIGENLINKIGIAITIIGVAIGAKYSIENNLISPLTRIIIGYVFGILVFGFGLKLKKNYVNFSAVLVSGAMTIMYFITYAGFSFYSLFPQLTAFTLMFLFTAITVHLALKYNLQVIAHIGLVGAYAVPFLLSEGSGKVEILFTYMSIINIGILVISFQKYWKSLYYAAFILSWLVFGTWYGQSYVADSHFNIGLFFGTVFFLLFYISFLAYKIFRNKTFEIEDIVLLLVNSFVFYAFGYSILGTTKGGENLQGLFTIFNALIHLIASFVVYKQKLADKNLLLLIVGLVAVFVTITIPVQLDGNWVTLLWLGETLVLFYIGRIKQSAIYEKLAYPLMVLAFGSIIQDWSTNYNTESFTQLSHTVRPLLNINFLTSMLFVAGFVGMWYVDRLKKYIPAFNRKSYPFIPYIIPIILIISVYYSFYVEIVNYWIQLFNNTCVSEVVKSQNYGSTVWNYDLLDYKLIWTLNYTMLFLSVLTYINSKYFRINVLSQITLILLCLTLLFYLVFGLSSLADLRNSFLDQDQANYFPRTVQNSYIRYISFVFLIPALVSAYSYRSSVLFDKLNRMHFDVALNIVMLWMLSSELQNILALNGVTQTDKLGISILWGVYSLLLIVVGIWKNLKHLRIAAIALFGATLVKLFIYDLSQLSTISKTILFVS